MQAVHCCVAFFTAASFCTSLAVSLLSVRMPASGPLLTASVKSCPIVEHLDRKSTRLNSSHSQNSYAVFCLPKKFKAHWATSLVCANEVIACCLHTEAIS